MSASRLYAKLAEVVAAVGYVAKDGKNDFQNYRYTSAEALLATIRGPLSERGIVLMPSVTAVSEREYTTSKGKASIITTAHVSFTLVDGETGERHECQWAGQGDDPGDKGLGKAYTNAIKTFLREQFLIPQGDDPEADRATDERAADRSRKQQNGKPDVLPEEPKLPEAAVASLRRVYAETGWSIEQLRMNLTAVGVVDTKDVKAAMRSLTDSQAEELLTSMNIAIDQRTA